MSRYEALRQKPFIGPLVRRLDNAISKHSFPGSVFDDAMREAGRAFEPMPFPPPTVPTVHVASGAQASL